MKFSKKGLVFVGSTTALLIAGAGLTVIGLAGCGKQPAVAASDANGNDEAAKSGRKSRVETVRVETRDLVKTVEMPGTVEGFESVDLYAKVGGYLQEFSINPETQMSIDIGDRVQKDEVLATLFIPEMEKELQRKVSAANQAEAEVEQARAAVHQAEANVESSQASFEEAETELAEKESGLEYRRADHKRYQKLVEANAARGELLDQAKSQYEAAAAAVQTVKARIRTAEANLKGIQANLAKARADLKAAEAHRKVAQTDVEYVHTMMQYAEITAPFDGMVTERWVHTGAFIQPAEGNSGAKPLLTVKRIDPVRIFLEIPMNDVRLLDRGDRAVLDRINVLPGEKSEGTVTRFATALNVSSRMMRVEIDLPNPDGRLMPGYYGYVTLYLEELRDTPVIPSSAILIDGDEKFVYVCANGCAQKRIVSTNFEDGTLVGIESGLLPGEQVIRSGGGQISDGQSVTPMLTQTEPAAAR